MGFYTSLKILLFFLNTEQNYFAINLKLLMKKKIEKNVRSEFFFLLNIKLLTMGKITSALKTKCLLSLLLISAFGFSQSIATYSFTFESDWSSTNHGTLPGNAHWSNMVGATHNTMNEFLELGVVATNGIKRVAELGSNSVFFDEVDAAITAGDANQWLQMAFEDPNDASSGVSLVSMSVSKDFPLLTLVSMIAPSPDWFIAINSLNLRNMADDGWRDTFTIDVFGYDSGTDDGANYTSVDSPNSPVGIFMINGAPFSGNKMGTLTLTLESVLGIESPSLETGISISPNPASDFIAINNNSNKALQSIYIYNVLGNLVKKIQANSVQQQIIIPMNQLNSGIYLVKIEAQNGESVTKKIVVN